MRRLILRSFCVVFLLLCGAGWVAAHTNIPNFEFTTKHHYIIVALNRGCLIVYWAIPSTGEYAGDELGFHTSYYPANEERDIYWMNSDPSFLGFYGDIGSTFGVSGRLFLEREVGVPFWFFTLLITGITSGAWRKTRPKPDPATAFPVELKS